MVKELPKNQLRPTAQPVSRFLSYGEQDPAAPTKPTMAPTPKGINIVQRSNEMSIKGYNSFTEWSNSMKQVSGAIATAAPVIKSDQERRGRNDVLKALRLHSRQTLQNGLEYAEENRKVSRDDWIAGLNMDQVNPWRRGGMEEQLSILAGGEAETYIKRAVQSATSELIGLDPADPRFDQVRGNAVAQLVNDFGINETSVGFADHALPKINSAWAKALDDQFEAHAKYEKLEQKTLTKRQLKQSMEFYHGVAIDPESLQLTLGGILDYQASKLGLSGEPSEFKEEVLLELYGDYQLAASQGDDKAEGMLNILGSIPVRMIKDGDGNVVDMISADEALGTDFFLNKDKLGEAAWRTRNREIKTAKSAFASKHAASLIFLDSRDPAYEAKLKEILTDPEFENIPIDQKITLVKDWKTADEEWAEVLWVGGKQGVDDVFAKYNEMSGVLFDPDEFRKELTEAMVGLPNELKEYGREQWNNAQSLISKKTSEARVNFGDINTHAAKLSKAIVTKAYPKDFPVSNAENLDPLLYTEQQKEAALVGKAIIDDQLSRVGRDAIEKANEDAIEKDINLSQNQLIKIAKDAQQEWFKDENNWKDLLPPIGVKEESKEGFKPTLGMYSLDSRVPDNRFIEGAHKQHPVYNSENTGKLVELLRDRSVIPGSVKRGANLNNISPAQYIYDNAQFYQGADWYPNEEEWIELLKEGNNSKGIDDSLQSASPYRGPLSDATNYLSVVLTGNFPSRLTS